MSSSPFSQALSPDAKMLHLVAQGQIHFEDATRWFESLREADQQPWLKTVALMCHQAHPRREEIDRAITFAGLKPAFTPCVMLRNAVQPEQTLDRIAALPADERQKAFCLMLALYCISDTRRRQTDCRNGCSHAWHNLDVYAA